MDDEKTVNGPSSVDWEGGSEVMSSVATDEGVDADSSTDGVD